MPFFFEGLLPALHLPRRVGGLLRGLLRGLPLEKVVGFDLALFHRHMFDDAASGCALKAVP